MCEAYEVGLDFPPGTITIMTPTQILQLRTLAQALLVFVSTDKKIIIAEEETIFLLV